MLGVQMFAEFLDIESLKFVAGKTEAARAFLLSVPVFNCFSYYTAFPILLRNEARETEKKKNCLL